MQTAAETEAAGAVTMARKGIPYDRFSGKRQEAGDSLRRQEDLAEQAGREEGVQLDRTLCLRDKGLSAFRGANWKRGNLGKFLDLVDAGLISPGTVLIIEQVNRLSRMPWMKQVELWKEILERGIIIRTCTPPSRYTRENMNDLSVGCPVVILMMLAHQDSVQKSDWVRQAWGEKKRHAAEENRPHGRRVPRWIRPVTAPHPKNPTRTVTLRYELIEERVALLRRIYEWAVEGWGAWRIHRQLELDGTPPWGTATHWAVSTVKHLLTTRTVIGEYEPFDRQADGTDVPRKPIPNYYPAALPESLFLAAQASQRGRRKKGGRRGKDGRDTNLFTHLVHEATTRTPMQCCSVISKGIQYHYLHTDPRTDGAPYLGFERGVLAALARLKARDVDGRHQVDALTARVDGLQGDRARVGLELDALDVQLRELPPGKWPKRIVARVAELEQRATALDEELRQAKEAANTSGRTETLTDLHLSIAALDEARGTDREPAVRARIKARVPLLVDQIWVRVQAINKAQRWLHVRLYLHGGAQRYYPIFCGKGDPSADAWELGNADFRAGEEGGDAVDAEPSGQLVTKQTAS